MSDVIWGLHMAEIEPTAPLEENFIGIGWEKMGDLSAISPSREHFKDQFTQAYPNEKMGAIPVKAGVLYRFACEIAIGDIVIYPSKSDRMVNIGLVEGEYSFHVDLKYPHRRKVKWLKRLPRSIFSQSALHEIGSAITMFRVATNADEFKAALDGQATGAEDIDDETADEIAIQVEETTEDFIIKRLKTKLSPYEFERFIAHLLICMGYHARVTQQSSDGGIDVIAHKDELGFEPPIIKVQCKQTLDQIGRPKVQELHGAIEPGEHGLFVTLGPFSNEARIFERTKPNLRLIDGNALIELIYAHYAAFDTRYKILLPLRNTYIPGAILDPSF